MLSIIDEKGMVIAFSHFDKAKGVHYFNTS